jgi:hypothetical protein
MSFNNELTRIDTPPPTSGGGRDNDEKRTVSTTGTFSSLSPPTIRTVNFRKDEVPFPLKLHKILEDAETMAFDDIIAWMPDGLSFRVFDKVRLEEVVMPQYFSSGKFVCTK